MHSVEAMTCPLCCRRFETHLCSVVAVRTRASGFTDITKHGLHKCKVARFGFCCPLKRLVPWLFLRGGTLKSESDCRIFKSLSCNLVRFCLYHTTGGIRRG